MPGLNGIEVLEQIKQVSPDTEVGIGPDGPRQHGDRDRSGAPGGASITSRSHANWPEIEGVLRKVAGETRSAA